MGTGQVAATLLEIFAEIGFDYMGAILSTNTGSHRQIAGIPRHILAHRGNAEGGDSITGSHVHGLGQIANGHCFVFVTPPPTITASSDAFRRTASSMSMTHSSLSSVSTVVPAE